ncbi:MAG: Crp/Fnr family transcriptional regulator [Candidatus Roizmanbacteria bacterium]
MAKSKPLIWHLRDIDLFKGLDEKMLTSFEKEFDFQDHEKRQIIFSPDDRAKVGIVRSGKVEIYHLSSDGKKTIIDVLGRGSIFGDFGERISADIFAETVQPSQICFIKKEAFFTLASRDPQVAQRLMKHLFDKLAKMEDKVSSIASDNVFDRLVKLILQLGKRDEKSGVYYTEKYTHEELAQMIGVSRQTVTTILIQLEKAGDIQRNKKQFRFDKENLLKLIRP